MGTTVRFASLLLLVVHLSQADLRPPEVKVYSRLPAEVGKPNTLICYCEKFYPPNIEVTLLKNGEVMEGTMAKDMSFDQDWTYYFMKYSNFIYNPGDKLDCKVAHNGMKATVHTWDPKL
uniref:Beta2-microglobuin n=1 Tax=Andrias davidianus TaxID=141262 RepID=U5QAZ5_ANDDA|nr:beta2-microglobuin [Andrias davidianus]